MKKLKPCPFCGGEAECFTNKHGDSYCECYDEYNDYDCCGVKMPDCDTKENAIKAWNTRVVNIK